MSSGASTPVSFTRLFSFRLSSRSSFFSVEFRKSMSAGASPVIYMYSRFGGQFKVQFGVQRGSKPRRVLVVSVGSRVQFVGVHSLFRFGFTIEFTLGPGFSLSGCIVQFRVNFRVYFRFRVQSQLQFRVTLGCTCLDMSGLQFVSSHVWSLVCQGPGFRVQGLVQGLR